MRKAKEKKEHKGFMLRNFIRLAFFAFVIYALVSIISVQVTLSEKKDELAALKAQSEELKEKNSDSQHLLEVDDEKEYMERIAIEELGYSYPNETRYYDVSRN